MCNRKYDVNVGFSRVDITPPFGVNLLGYYLVRFADGILDNLEINAIAVEKDNKAAVILAVDNIGVRTGYLNKARRDIAEKTGIDISAVFIHSTHTHTGPMLDVEENLELEVEKEYARLVYRKMVDSAVMAIADMRPAKMGYAVSKAEGIGYNRRYLMKDGSIVTNPGVNNPDIESSKGLLDESVGVVRFMREDGSNIVIVNYANHADTVGGTKISADWVGQTRRIFERTVDNAKCLVLNGAEGDINHINVKPEGGEFNGLAIDFDSVPRGYLHTKHIGNVLCGAILQVYEKVQFVETKGINFATKTIQVPTNKATEEELEANRYINELYLAGREKELPYTGMNLTTVVANATRMFKVKDFPDTMPIIVSALTIGNIGFIGFPGEPFTGVGIELKKTEGYDLVLPCCLINGKEGYFPLQDSYEQGGYEAVCSIFKSGTAELLIQEGKKLLEDLK